MLSSRLRISQGGPEFSRTAHGLWRLKDWNKNSKQIQGMINGCLELGITTFDHADIYGDYICEDLFGAALAESSVRRSDIQLVTKCGIKLVSGKSIKHYDTSAAHIQSSVENSLKNLRTDYIDLLLIHRPDPLMNAKEVAEAFARLRESGKVLHFGVSNFLPSQFEMLSSQMDFPLVTNQVEFSALNMEAQDNGTLDMCQKLRISPMAWSPLAGGRLFKDDSDQIKHVKKALNDVAAEHDGTSFEDIALAWIFNHPAEFVVVLGTGNIDRIRKAVAAEKIKLTREEWFTIWTASTGHDVP